MRNISTFYWLYCFLMVERRSGQMEATFMQNSDLEQCIQWSNRHNNVPFQGNGPLAAFIWFCFYIYWEKKRRMRRSEKRKKWWGDKRRKIQKKSKHWLQTYFVSSKMSSNSYIIHLTIQQYGKTIIVSISGVVARRSNPTPEARGSSQEEQPHIQGVVAVWAQEGLEEPSHIEGQEGW